MFYNSFGIYFLSLMLLSGRKLCTFSVFLNTNLSIHTSMTKICTLYFIPLFLFSSCVHLQMNKVSETGKFLDFVSLKILDKDICLFNVLDEKESIIIIKTTKRLLKSIPVMCICPVGSRFIKFIKRT